MKKIILLSILGLIAASATAEITLGNTGAGGEVAIYNAGNPTSITLSEFDAGTEADTFVVVAVATKMAGDLDNPVNYVSIGGTALTELAGQFVDDGLYKGWAILYGGAASGTGDVVVNYTAATEDTTYYSEGVAFSVASYSDVAGTDAVGTGAFDKSNPGALSDSITTTNANSLIVSCLMVGGPDTGITGVGSTVVVQEHGSPDKIDGALLSLNAPTAGTYAPGGDWSSSQSREAIISVELMEQAAPKATTFIVR